jgi:hypothetical protein
MGRDELGFCGRLSWYYPKAHWSSRSIYMYDQLLSFITYITPCHDD